MQPKAPPKRPTGVFYGWWVVAGSALINAVGGGVHFYGFSVFFLPLKEDLHLTSAATALVFSLSRAEGAFEGPLAGYLIDRFGARVMIFLGAAVVAVGYVLLSRTDSFLGFVLVYLLVISLAFNMSFGSATMAAVTKWFVRRRSMALALVTAAFGVGGAFVTPILSLLVRELGWRSAAVIAGGAVAALVLPASLLVRSSPESMGLRPDGDAALAQEGAAQQEVDFSLREAVRTAAFWVLAVATMLRIGVFGALIVHFIPIMVWKGQDQASAAFLLAALAFLGIPLRLLFGWLGDRWYKPTLVALGMVTVTAAMVILQYAQASWQLWVFVVVMAVGEGITVLNWATMGDFFGRRHFATIRGTMGLIFTWGMVIMPVLVGYIFDRTQSYSAAIWLFAALGALAVVAWALLRPPKPQARSVPKAA
ncbi:MAG: MFS transporter [Dehalococcoidia bacterium]|nr:MFS transporter [Dehalococcoidia bacterium]